ncbi:MAG: hypothetical protein ACRD3J_13980, partial [Thermoanaerobaculia bacterium]
GENRVTASILAVLRSLSLRHAERLLSAALGTPELQLIDFSNQVSRGGPGVPDAVISASIRLLVETKTARNAVDISQLRRHLERLEASNETTKMLLVLTPDASRPSAMTSLPPEVVVWSSFAALDQAIDELLRDRGEVVSEREAFLLRELQLMLEAENLLAAADEVLVVAASLALNEYRDTSAYVCQPNRTFRDVDRMAFYTMGEIAPLVPKILAKFEAVEFQRGVYDGPLGVVVDTLVNRALRPEGRQYKVILLTPMGDHETIRLNAPIVNDLTSETGRNIAFTQGQRYVSLIRLRAAKRTSELIGLR